MGQATRLQRKRAKRMFKVTDCVLKSTKSGMTAVITLSGTGYDYLYMGTGADAVEEGESAKWIPYKKDSEGKVYL